MKTIILFLSLCLLFGIMLDESCEDNNGHGSRNPDNDNTARPSEWSGGSWNLIIGAAFASLLFLPKRKVGVICV